MLFCCCFFLLLPTICTFCTPGVNAACASLLCLCDAAADDDDDDVCLVAGCSWHHTGSTWLSMLWIKVQRSRHVSLTDCTVWWSDDYMLMMQSQEGHRSLEPLFYSLLFPFPQTRITSTIILLSNPVKKFQFLLNFLQQLRWMVATKVQTPSSTTTVQVVPVVQVVTTAQLVNNNNNSICVIWRRG